MLPTFRPGRSPRSIRRYTWLRLMCRMRATSEAVSKPSSEVHRSLSRDLDFALREGGRLLEVVCLSCFIFRMEPGVWFRGEPVLQSIV